MSDRSARASSSEAEPQRAALEKYARAYPPGHVLFEEGDPGDRMYVVHAGRVRIFKRVGDTEITLATLGPGEFFGEMAILDGQPRSAAAVVLARNTVLIELSTDVFERSIRESGEIALRMLRRLAARLREANRQVAAFVAQSGASRALEVLAALAGLPGPDLWRPLPDFFDPSLLATRGGLTLGQSREILSHLSDACLVADRGGRLHLAPERDVEDYRRYLEMKAHYDPLTVRELSEMTGMSEDDVHRAVKKLIAAKLGEADGDKDLVDSYRHYLLLKRRFEYPEAATGRHPERAR